MATAGRILIIPKGEWESNITYEALDLVSHNYNSWLCKKTASGIEPAEDKEEYWFKFTNNVSASEMLKEVSDVLNSKADQSTLNALSETVGNKADKSTVISIETKLGGSDISGIANGTITGVLAYLSSLVKIQAVDELPANPDRNILYVIREE